RRALAQPDPASDFVRATASPAEPRYAFSFSSNSSVSLQRQGPVEGCENFHIKSCCHQPEARLVASRFSTIVLGGTAALHAQSGVGGGNFFADEDLPLSSCSCSCSCSIYCLSKATA